MSTESQVPQESTTPTPTSATTDQAATSEEQVIEAAAESGATPTKEAESVSTVEALDAQEKALAEMGEMKFYTRGDLIEGTIVQVTDDTLIVDIGTKTEGIISREEISIDSNPDLSEFNVGDKVNAIVLDEDEEGTYHLSKRRADQKLVWEIVDESLKSGTRMMATGFRAVKGGLLVNIGHIAFLPQSLVDIRRVDDLESLVGEKFEVKVVEYDREAKPHPKIVVSRRAILEEDLTRERDKVYDTLTAGAVIDGKVIKLTNYGAFVDVGGLQGLLHVSEMSLGRIKHPNEVMKEGETIKVKVLKIDKKRKRISLGRRDLLPNPWEEINKKFKAGTVVEGTVVRTADFGAFVKLDDYFEGLAHISELVDNKISHAREVFRTGDKVDVLIMNIDRKSRRIKLSVRRAAEAQRKAEVDEFMKSQDDLGNVFGSQLQEALQVSEIDLPVKEETAPEAEEEKPDAVAEVAAEPESAEPAEPEEAPAEAVEPEEAPVEAVETVETVEEEAASVSEEPPEEPVAAAETEEPVDETPPEDAASPEVTEDAPAAEETAEAAELSTEESVEEKAEEAAEPEPPAKPKPRRKSTKKTAPKDETLGAEMNGTPLE